eukprot:5038911-Pleurochrysis_carterae.AAC.3
MSGTCKTKVGCCGCSSCCWAQLWLRSSGLLRCCRTGGIQMVTAVSRSTGTGYPTDLRKPYIYAQTTRRICATCCSGAGGPGKRFAQHHGLVRLNGSNLNALSWECADQLSGSMGRSLVSQARGAGIETQHHQKATNTCCCPTVLQPPKPGRTVNGQQVSGFRSAAKAKKGCAVLLKSNAGEWLGEDVRRVVLALDVLRLDSAISDQLADLELAAVDVL